MSITSKTGLLPSVKKKLRAEIQVERSVTLELPKLVVPAPFTLRPFAGIYNSFPYGCSILCNHPTDFEAKAIVQRAKDAWATEGKSLIDSEEHAALQHHKKTETHSRLASTEGSKSTQVSEDLFRKYIETNSMPRTPEPTLVSAATKISPYRRTRRCLTPDPISFIPTKEKTFLVLDLRRSHSQETVSWQKEHGTDANLELDVIQDENVPRYPSSNKITMQYKRKKTPRKKSMTSTGTASSLKTQNSKESDSKIQTQQSVSSQSPTRSSILLDQDRESGKIRHTSPDSISSESIIIKRRGKRRKGKRSGKNTLKEGDKEFKGIPDPGETQVSALGSESKEGSSRPSLSEVEVASEGQKANLCRENSKKELTFEEEKSFLNSDILRQLQRQLDQEVVDSEMNIKRKKALEEALRHKSNNKSAQPGEYLKVLKKEFQVPIKNSETWLTIPRVFSRRSARFELPMDSRLLNDMTPFEYVKNYAFPSPARLVLYNHVFNLYKEEPEDEEQTERILLGKNVINCLGKIMGRPMTSDEAEDFQNLIGWKNEQKIHFRTFTGISAACERLLGPKFCSKMPSQEEDPRNEVERADFETLQYKLSRLKPDVKLLKILKSIRDL